MLGCQIFKSLQSEFGVNYEVPMDVSEIVAHLSISTRRSKTSSLSFA